MTLNLYDHKVKELIERHGKITPSLLQVRLKVDRDKADEIYKKYTNTNKTIQNHVAQTSYDNASTYLIKKHSCYKVSAPYLQKRIGLSLKDTEKLLKEWINSDEKGISKRKFDVLRRYVKPPIFDKKDTERTVDQKNKDRYIKNCIKYLESQGFKVEKL